MANTQGILVLYQKKRKRKRMGEEEEEKEEEGKEKMKTEGRDMRKRSLEWEPGVWALVPDL